MAGWSLPWLPGTCGQEDVHEITGLCVQLVILVVN
jgi:hypothetical protein